MVKRRTTRKSNAANLRAADRALFKIGKKVEILERLRWSVRVRKSFINNWRRGTPELPQVKMKRQDLSGQREALQDIIRSVDARDPVGKIIRETAQHFYLATRMVENIGKKSFHTYSARLYGLPDDVVTRKGATTLGIAKKMLRSSGKFKLANIAPPEEVCLLPEFVAQRIRKEVKRKFKGMPFTVLVDSKLTAKASAGPDRIRVRGSTCFAPYDIDQLIAHELFVHSLTILNGRKQKYKVFGLNSPRTTCTQEGLAVFAEFITGSIDVNRLQRISARVQAIQMGIDGADFLDVFQFFLKHGQSEDEAYYSAKRIFRGGNVKGGVVFTKDLVYFKGFVEVHKFFIEALRAENYLYPHYIFAGRMTTEDVPLVAELIENGVLSAPYYEPDWVANRSTLLGFLLSNSMMTSLGLS